MLKKITVFFAIIFTLFIVNTNLFGDVRSDNIELFLVVDKSKSMVEEISDVTSYINKTFIGDFLIPGDRLVFIQFYGQADLVYDEIITETSIKSIKTHISGIPADGRFTDIGNALDVLNNEVETSSPTELRRYLILMTDGKQEAPEDSPYYSPDGSFNHEFLKNTKIIQKKGWKILILGIGADTAVRELSDELLTTYEELDFSDDSAEVISNEEILGRITAENLSIENMSLSIELTSEGYTTGRIITIEQILYQISSGNHKLLSKPLDIEIMPEETKLITIELDPDMINNIVNDGEKGNLLFNFEGDTPFLPAAWESTIALSAHLSAAAEESDKNISEKTKNDGNNSFNWLIIVIVIIAAAAVLAVILIRNTLFHRDEDEKREDNKHEISGDN